MVPAAAALPAVLSTFETSRLGTNINIDRCMRHAALYNAMCMMYIQFNGFVEC